MYSDFRNFCFFVFKLQVKTEKNRRAVLQRYSVL